MGPEGCVPVTPPLGRLSLGQAVHLHSPLERPVPHRVLPALLSSTSLLAEETRVATREESGVLGFPSRRGLTPRGSLECNPEIPAFPGEEY